MEVAAAGDVQYDFIWRRGDGGAPDVTLATFTHHFEPPPSFMAVEYDADAPGIAADAAAGDQLIWRWSVTAATPGARIIPNGDGTSSGGRFPSIRVPR